MSALDHLGASLINNCTSLCSLADESPFCPSCRLLALFASIFISDLALVSKAYARVSKLFLMLSLFYAAVLPSEPAGNGFSPKEQFC